MAADSGPPDWASVRRHSPCSLLLASQWRLLRGIKNPLSEQSGSLLQELLLLPVASGRQRKQNSERYIGDGLDPHPHHDPEDEDRDGPRNVSLFTVQPLDPAGNPKELHCNTSCVNALFTQSTWSNHNGKVVCIYRSDYSMDFNETWYCVYTLQVVKGT
jgi:hypothetical protein